jgi:predicted RNase H-like nuclease
VICPTLADALDHTARAELTLVDIPLGLDDRRHFRACDLAARALLGARRSSIFPVPVRAAVHARDYATASALNHAATGRKLSLQSWNICGKIAEADLALRNQPSLQVRLHESHPELCFAALNRWTPLSVSKKTREGQAERLALLERHTPGAVLPTGFPRSQVAPDDVLDAMVLAVSAALAVAHGLPRLPATPEVDSFGLHMALTLPYPPGR